MFFMTDVSVKINPESFFNEFKRSVFQDIGALRTVLRKLDDNSFFDSMNLPNPSIVMPLNFEKNEDKNFLTDHEIKKCFKSVITSFIDLVDRLLSLILLNEEKIRVPKPMSGNETSDYFLKKMDEKFLETANLRHLSFDEKCKKIGVNENTMKILRGYMDLRNCFEHKKSIADHNIKYVVHENRLKVGKKIITKLPLKVEKGSVISLNRLAKENVINSGNNARLTEEEIEDIVYTIVLEVLPSIDKTFRKTLKEMNKKNISKKS